MKLIALTLLLATIVFGEDNTENTKVWNFEAKLDGTEFGYHNFTITDSGSRTKVRSKAKYDYYLAFIRVFKYRHEAKEVWSDGCLKKVSSTTNNDGSDEYLKTLNTGADQLKLSSHLGESTLDGCVGAYSYWNLDLLKDRDKLLNPQNGKYLPIEFKKVGQDQVNYNGKAIDTVKYQLKVDGEVVTLWYTKNDKIWIKLRSELKNDKILEYVPKKISALDS